MYAIIQGEKERHYISIAFGYCSPMSLGISHILYLKHIYHLFLCI